MPWTQTLESLMTSAPIATSFVLVEFESDDVAGSTFVAIEHRSSESCFAANWTQDPSATLSGDFCADLAN